MFTISQVSKRYGATIAVNDLSVDVQLGTVTAILGPSGCGKTTLLRLMAFLEPPDSGTIHLSLDGTLYDSQSTPEPWPKVTMVFQRQFLWPHMTLRQNIELPLCNLSDNDRADRVRSTLDIFDMADFVDRYPNEVSGGQGQRAALARAFALHPDVILLDEAHSFLDLEQQHALNNELGHLRQEGITLVVVTHSLSFARRYADRILVMEKGALVESGDASILSSPKSSFLSRVSPE